MSETPAEPTRPRLELLSKRDVAAELGVSTRWVDQKIAKGVFPRADLRLGRAPRWKWPTIAKWIDAGGTAGRK